MNKENYEISQYVNGNGEILETKISSYYVTPDFKKMMINEISYSGDCIPALKIAMERIVTKSETVKLAEEQIKIAEKLSMMIHGNGNASDLAYKIIENCKKIIENENNKNKQE